MTTAEEATPEQAVKIARREVELANKADSLEHMKMHLETALIWLRNVDPADVRRLWQQP